MGGALLVGSLGRAEDLGECPVPCFGTCHKLSFYKGQDGRPLQLED